MILVTIIEGDAVQFHDRDVGYNGLKRRGLSVTERDRFGRKQVDLVAEILDRVVHASGIRPVLEG